MSFIKRYTHEIYDPERGGGDKAKDAKLMNTYHKFLKKLTFSFFILMVKAKLNTVQDAVLLYRYIWITIAQLECQDKSTS